MWNVHVQNSSWNRSLLCQTLKLHFWLSFGYRSGYRSGPRPRNRKCVHQRETISCCVMAGFIWLQASQKWFPQLQYCCERGHSIKGIKQNHLRAEAFYYLSMAGSAKEQIWVKGFRPSLQAQSQSTAYLRFFILVLCTSTAAVRCRTASWNEYSKSAGDSNVSKAWNNANPGFWRNSFVPKRVCGICADLGPCTATKLATNHKLHFGIVAYMDAYGITTALSRAARCLAMGTSKQARFM